MQISSGFRRFRSVMIFLMACCFSLQHAQSQEFIFNHLTSRDGLGSNFVYALWQDPSGYLWIGTENGLQRYDGYQFFSPYQSNNADRLPRLPVNQILCDTMGRMWLRMGKTIGIFDKATFRFKQVKVAKGINIPSATDLFIEKDGKGNVFLLARSFGWFYYDEQSTTFREDNTPFNIPRSFGLNTIFDDVKTGRCWLAGNNGLAYYDRNTKQLYRNGTSASRHLLLADPRLGHIVNNIYIDVKRRHWLTTWDTAALTYRNFCYDERTNGWSDDTLGLSSVSSDGYYEIHKFTEFADTTVLAYGLNFMAMREQDHFGGFVFKDVTQYSIVFNRVNAVIQDREQILWVATDNGLFNSMSKVNNSLHLLLRQTPKRSSINSLMEDVNGNIWMGTWGRGTLPRQRDLKKLEMPQFANPPKGDYNYDLVWDMHQQKSSGRIWFACQAGRLIVFDTAKSRPQYLKPAPFGGSTIRQVEEDKQGNIWFSTQSGKVLKWTKGSGLQDSAFKIVQHFGSILPRLMVDTRGLLWVATTGTGVKVLNTTTNQIVKQYSSSTTHDMLFGDHVRDIVQVNDSIYAFADDGLDLLNFNTGQITRAPGYKQWPVGPVLTMQVDNQHNVWLCTANGIYKYNLEGKHFIRFTQWDGLVSIYNNSFVMETSLKLSDGRIVFAGNSNLVSFDPQQYRDKALPPDVLIGSCKLFNEFLPVDSLMKAGSLTLPHNRNSITLTFAALSFTRIDKLSYYYKLEGANSDWQRMDGPLQVNYTLLPPGKYTFMVRARNEEGIYSPNITSLKINILPPFWRTIWFFGLVVLCIAGALYYLYRLRIRRLLQVEKIRTRLARDLHDDMGSTLSTINILSNMAAKKIDSDQKTSQDYMSRISDSSSRIMEAMDDIVWSINPVNDSMRKILARMKEFAGNVLEASDIEYSFTVDEAVKEMTFDMEWRREIFLVFKEAINNIAKYAKATQVDITLRRQKNMLVMIITDNGIGFSADKDQTASLRGNGLRNMRKRAEAMNGSLEIITAPKSGASVVLQIPLA